jgi:hypothetical protein
MFAEVNKVCEPSLSLFPALLGGLSCGLWLGGVFWEGIGALGYAGREARPGLWRGATTRLVLGGRPREVGALAHPTAPPGLTRQDAVTDPSWWPGLTLTVVCSQPCARC